MKWGFLALGLLVGCDGPLPSDKVAQRQDDRREKLLARAQSAVKQKVGAGQPVTLSNVRVDEKDRKRLAVCGEANGQPFFFSATSGEAYIGDEAVSPYDMHTDGTRPCA
jgi:hypothetical protein